MIRTLLCLRHVGKVPAETSTCSCPSKVVFDSESQNPSWIQVSSMTAGNLSREGVTEVPNKGIVTGSPLSHSCQPKLESLKNPSVFMREAPPSLNCPPFSVVALIHTLILRSILAIPFSVAKNWKSSRVDCPRDSCFFSRFRARLSLLFIVFVVTPKKAAMSSQSIPSK